MCFFIVSLVLEHLGAPQEEKFNSSFIFKLKSIF